MSRLGREISRGLRYLRKLENDPVFTWNGQDYPCTANEAASSKIFGLGGFSLVADLTLFIEASVLPDPGPKEKQTVSYRGKTYRIDKVAHLPGDDQIKLICNSPTKGS